MQPLKSNTLKKTFRGMPLTFICPDINCLEIKPLGDCAHVVTKEPKIKESQLRIQTFSFCFKCSWLKNKVGIRIFEICFSRVL